VKSVLVFSASAVVRAGLESIVNSAGALTAVGSAGSAEELLEEVASREPDVLLADVDSSDSDSLTGILQAADAVVTLTDDADAGPVDDAIRLGRRAVLPRNAAADEIQAAVEGAAAGLVVLHPSRAVVLTGAVAPVRQRSEGLEHLTPREIEVLGMMAEGLGNKTIARRLGISEHTVKFHVGSVMGKLNASSRTEAVTTGVRQGLIMV
jgi:two-component system, NarL family, response regulator YdfI